MFQIEMAFSAPSFLWADQAGLPSESSGEEREQVRGISERSRGVAEFSSRTDHRVLFWTFATIVKSSQEGEEEELGWFAMTPLSAADRFLGCRCRCEKGLYGRSMGLLTH